MASLTKTTKGGWQAQVAKHGTRKSKTFPTKALAKEWADNLERELASSAVTGFAYAGSIPIVNLLIRYEEEQGDAWSKSKSNAVGRLIKDMTLNADELTPVRVKEWATKREYGLGTTRIDLATLQGALKHARDVWFYELNVDAVSAAYKSLEKSGAMPVVNHNDRRISEEEEHLIRENWQSNRIPPYVVDFLIDTPIRSGEMCALTKEDVDGRIITIRDRKDPKEKHRIDRVPLLGRSVEVMDKVWGHRPFPYSQAKVNEAIVAACEKAELSGITAHTCRHEGISRMFEKGYGVPQVSLVSGHKKWDTLKRYTHITAESLIR